MQPTPVGGTPPGGRGGRGGGLADDQARDLRSRRLAPVDAGRRRSTPLDAVALDAVVDAVRPVRPVRSSHPSPCQRIGTP
jgi:hypothetical protein